ncbi:MAG: DNA methyltransferase [Chloroflexi bacterium]|nr:DNA methyltransferase [Chloroflexota bacterium]
MVELIWDGKYDNNKKRVAPLRVALPFQTVETVNESAQQRQRTLDLFAAGRDAEWRNRLIWGDKKYVLPSLLPEFAGKVDLIYIDPPFATGQDFSFQAQVGEEKFTKEASMIEQKAYRDTWGQGLDSYLAWFYDTAVFLHELLSETGSLYVHLDSHVSHYVKTVLDSVFGKENCRRELIWHLHGAAGFKAQTLNWVRGHDTLFYYLKSDECTFNKIFLPYDEKQLKRFSGVDETGRRYKTITKTRRLYLDEAKGIPATSVWSDVASFQTVVNSPEIMGYPTQKPEALLERIIRASSNEGDLVLDCFCGSGTTAAVAEKNNRRWIACDLGRFAIHTTRKRLLGIENVRPFVVQNLGKYERQVWQKAQFGDDAASEILCYRKFILDLYHADMVEGYAWLHGVKGGRLVHVGSVDSPVALDDTQQITNEFQLARGFRGVDILGWDFALDMNETARQIAAEAGVDARFLRIPREVLEKKAVDQGDIQFFELAALEVDKSVKGRELSIELREFIMPPDDVPDDVANAVNLWEDWIDYWAVDFNYRDDTFHNQWQTYRTRKDRTLLLRANHTYSEPGNYVVLVKVIDILGNDTTKSLTVRVN